MVGMIKHNDFICLIGGQSVRDPTLAGVSSPVEPDIESAPEGTLEDSPGTSTQHPLATHTYLPATTTMDKRGSTDSTPDQTLVIEITSKCM